MVESLLTEVLRVRIISVYYDFAVLIKIGATMFTTTATTTIAERLLPNSASDAGPLGPGRSLRRFTGQHPLTALWFGLAFITLPLMSLPIAAHRGLIPGAGLIADTDVERVASVIGIAALVAITSWIAAAAYGRDGLIELWHRTRNVRLGRNGWALVAALPTLTVLLAVASGRPLSGRDLASTLGSEILATLVAFALINLWEETVWAGFVQPHFQRSRSLKRAALLTAIPFTVFHLPLQFVDPDIGVGLAAANAIAVFIVASIVRVLLAYSGHVMKGSTFGVAVMHTMFNRSNNDDGIAADLLDGRHAGFGILATIVLVTVLALSRRRSHRSRVRTSTSIASDQSNAVGTSAAPTPNPNHTSRRLRNPTRSTI